jgi:hypothetical protein
MNEAPQFPASWKEYSKGRSRLIDGKLLPVPDYVFVNMGSHSSRRNESPKPNLFQMVRF